MIFTTKRCEAPLFLVGNCSDGSTPAAALATALDGSDRRRTELSLECTGEKERDDPIKDACDALERLRRCMSAAISVAATQYPVTEQDIYEDVGRELGAVAGDTFRSDASGRAAFPSLGFANKLLGVVNVYRALRDAASSCG